MTLVTSDLYLFIFANGIVIFKIAHDFRATLTFYINTVSFAVTTFIIPVENTEAERGFAIE